ncbi:hypothetical protein [Krasilnikovia sp. M28-CT-15]|uniref:hypothetical protein n=1 Tax=Krasilnikovia sp. M28-CT-15 TaxID=3373540 RepID=UPI003876C6CD
MHESARPGIHHAEAPDWTHDAPTPSRPADDEPTEPIEDRPTTAAAEAAERPPAADAADGTPAMEDADGPPARPAPPHGTGGVAAGDPIGRVGTPPQAGPLDEPTAELPVLTPRTGPGRWTARIALGIVALSLVGGATVAMRRADEPRSPAGTAAPAGRWGGGPPGAARGAATAPLDGRTTAGLDLVDAATAIRLRTADLGDDLYRVSTPPGAGALPRVTDDGGRVRLALDRTAGGGPAEVDVALSARVRWDLRVAGGTSLSVLDLRDGRLGTVDLAGGASQVDLTLPRPDGTLTVRMTGGVSRFDVHTAARVPLRVRVGAGAGQVVLAGQAHTGVAAGALFTVDGWQDAVDRIDVDAVAGVSALTVAPYAPA